MDMIKVNIVSKYDVREVLYASDVPMRTNIVIRTEGGRLIATDAALAAGLRPKTLHTRIRSGWDERDWLIPSGTPRAHPKKIPGER